ncbi:hypothetical protein GF362_01530 [Candidatus Dojkabacteria bacterium]|nr:hypothetical protein [Candidatus Dojkabacteria bacterium]
MHSAPEAQVPEELTKKAQEQQKEQNGEREQEAQKTEMPVEELVKRQEGMIGKIVKWIKGFEAQDAKRRIQEIKDKEHYDKWRKKIKQVEKKWRDGTMLRNTAINLAGYFALLIGIINPLAAGPLSAFFAATKIPPFFIASLVRGTPPWRNLEGKIREFFDKKRDDYQEYQSLLNQNPDSPTNKRIRRNMVRFEEAAKRAKERKENAEKNGEENQDQEAASEGQTTGQQTQPKATEVSQEQRRPQTKEDQIQAIQNRTDIPEDVKEALVRALRG